MALNGSLDDYSPAGALCALASDGRTGAVRFTGAGGCTVYLFEGQLYFARADDTDDALASALVRPNRLTADQWTRAVDEAGDAPRVGELLIAHGSIEADLLASVVLSVIYEPADHPLPGGRRPLRVRARHHALDRGVPVLQTSRPSSRRSGDGSAASTR